MIHSIPKIPVAPRYSVLANSQALLSISWAYNTLGCTRRHVRRTPMRSGSGELHPCELEVGKRREDRNEHHETILSRESGRNAVWCSGDNSGPLGPVSH